MTPIIPDDKMMVQLRPQFITRAPIDEPGTIRTNDDIHKSIHLCPVTKTIIDTPQMQRLRGLKQLGTAELVYTTATHTRFEHSLGVGHLAEKKLKGIKDRQPRLKITEKDVLCVKIAGLCHDLGHGPFSHVYDGLFRKELKKAKGNDHLYKDLPSNCRMVDGWRHEDASLMMIDALLKHLGLEIDYSEENLDMPLRQIGDGIDATRFGIYGYNEKEDVWYDGSQELPQDFVLTSRDWIFIKECIVGGPLPPTGMSIKAAKSSDRVKLEIVGRTSDKEYLYDIISNIHSGLDVDKMDYFSRDGCRTATGESAFNDFLLENAYVAKGQCEVPHQECWKCKGKPCKDNNYHLMVAYQSPKTINTAMSFFRHRFNNYKNIYEHHKTKASSYMISDIFALADPYYRLPSSKLPISLAMCNPDAYLKLKDSIIDIIESTDDEHLQPAKELIERYRSRNLYKRVAEQPISTNLAWATTLWEMDEEEITHELVIRSCTDVSSSDIIVEKIDMHFGMKEENRKFEATQLFHAVTKVNLSFVPPLFSREPYEIFTKIFTS
jgi:HD superfamily phosphohydrolase